MAGCLEGRCRCQATSNDADTKNGKEEDAKKRRPLSRRRGRRIVKKAKMSVRFSLPSYCGLFAKPHNMGDSFLGAEMRGGGDGTLYGFGRSLLQPLPPQKKRISSELAARDNEMVWNKSDRRGRERDCMTFFGGRNPPKIERQFRMCITSTDFTSAAAASSATQTDIGRARTEEQRYLHHFSFVLWHSLAPKSPESSHAPYPPRSVGHSMPFLSIPLLRWNSPFPPPGLCTDLA